MFGENITVTITSYFAGGAYELDQTGVVQADATILVSDTITRKYYSFAGQTVAMKDNEGLKFLLTDHLGSVVAVTDAGGAILEQQRYLPFGGVRTISGSSNVEATDFGYTSQRNLDVQGNTFSLGLMDYKARFYSSSLGRFVQPDSIVPGGPQGLNRYSYVNNSPINFNDPTGHCVGPGGHDFPDGSPACDYDGGGSANETLDEKLANFGVILSGDWSYADSVAVYFAVLDVGNALSTTRGLNETAAGAFKSVYGTDEVALTFTWVQREGICNAGPYTKGGCTKGDHNIEFISMAPDNPIFGNRVRNAVHELGHLFSNRIKNNGVAFTPASWLSDNSSFVDQRSKILMPFTWDSTGIIEYKFSNDKTGSETFADMFVAFTYGVWNPTESEIRNKAMQQMRLLLSPFWALTKV